MKLKSAYANNIIKPDSVSVPLTTEELPSSIVEYFDRLSRLENIPFNLLVPDERMLPEESLRFFYIDSNWISALIDGAFSLGNFSATEYEVHSRIKDMVSEGSQSPDRQKIITGILLRSEVVKGWPGIEFKAYDKNSEKELPVLRIDHLSPNIIIALFDGELSEIQLHEPAESMHFGLDMPEGEASPPIEDPMNPLQYFKKTRATHDASVTGASSTPVVYRSDRKLVLNISAMAEAIRQEFPAEAAFTSAEIAYQMVEGVGQVTFHQK
ncbi:hypothetical protein CH352_02450 [Leptospira hartskeerlii]|uniref:Uncharacterized protein n=1 Tax=Leptospira hartskeerlii TaxID=2023177 RepID=A0A2M9XDC0_9LEPT|nr:hypothetical protein [Leptospira hartskeerlii]PJZ25687.1 hypothetical protein CH357_08525 [Leptospira hartskeerlii]PJZ35490.1 hypothetical protein CH352_02450 [Leptospira hartskeerlii]